MIYNIYILILFLFSYSVSFAQTDSTATTANNSVSLDILGIGGYGSLNYERTIFNFSSIRVGVRAGISTLNFTDYTTKFNPDIIIPISINALYGNKHNLELGAGQVISNIVQASKKNYKPERVFNAHANFTIGYRYQKKKGGFMFRLNYTPIIEFYNDYRHWGGVSVGYAF